MLTVTVGAKRMVDELAASNGIRLLCADIARISTEGRRDHCRRPRPARKLQTDGLCQERKFDIETKEPNRLQIKSAINQSTRIWGINMIANYGATVTSKGVQWLRSGSIQELSLPHLDCHVVISSEG